jgi:hypothetical protein
VPDKTTPIFILLLPVAIVLFRKPIDRLLSPLQKVKQHVPRLLLVGIGLALPYFVANYFYHHGVSNYPLARKSIVWGTILSYLVMRIPETSGLGKGLGGGTGFRMPSCWIWLLWFAVVGCFILAEPAFADHFKQTGYKDLEDGLRTEGWAQTIAGTGGTVINALVNGGLVFPRTPTSIPPPKGGGPSEPGEKGEKEEPTRYTMDIKTEDERKSLAADGKDRLSIYAQLTCIKKSAIVASMTRPLTDAIQFRFEGRYAEWMSIKASKPMGGYKGVLLAAEPPRPDAELEENAKVTVVVSGATAEGDPIEVPVELELEGKLKLDVEVLA